MRFGGMGCEYGSVVGFIAWVVEVTGFSSFMVGSQIISVLSNIA